MAIFGNHDSFNDAKKDTLIFSRVFHNDILLHPWPLSPPLLIPEATAIAIM